MSDIDKMLEQAESLQSEGEWEIISKYRRNDTYVDDDGAVNIAGRRIDAIRENISVQGENHSQYIEFIMDRYYDGIDIAEQTLAIHYEVGNVSDEDAPINVYKNDTQIKFGWVVENNLTQYEATIEFCIWARGTLADGNAYVLKTLPQKYEIKRGLQIAGGIIEPSTNWYTQFALNMDEKVAQAATSADKAMQAASSVVGVVETVTTARDEVTQKALIVDTQHSEVESWHQEVEQFRNEAEQFRNEAEQFTPDGYSNLIEQVNENTDEIEEINSSIEAGFKKQAQGEEIHITDAVDGKTFALSLFGKSEQKALSGKNLIPYPHNESNKTRTGVTFTDNGDGTVHVNGTNTKEDGTSYLFLINTSDNYILQKGTYIISGTPTENNSNGKCWLSVTRENDSVRIGADKGNGATFTLEEDTQIRIAIIVEASATANNLTFKPMLRLASIEDDTYEPYTGGYPSPNPDYPQPIESSGEKGFVEVKSVGKNLLNIDTRTQTADGVTLTVNEIDKSIIANGTATKDVNFVISRYSGDASQLNGKFFSGSVGGSSATYFLRISDTVNSASDNLDGTSKIATLTNTGTIRVSLFVRAGVTLNNVKFYPMISEDGGEYEPYKETISTIPTPNGLASVNDARDVIVKYADGSGKHIRRIAKRVFNGVDEEVWNLDSSISEKRFLIRCLDSKYTNYRMFVMCSHGKFATSGHTNGVAFLFNSNFYLYKSDAESVDEFKAWLSENNMTIYYELAEPIVTQLTKEEITEIEKLQTFSPVTNISNDADCGMSVTYATVKEALMLQEALSSSKANAEEIVNVKEEIVDIKKELSDTTFKVDTIIEKADLGIKETASGEEIHLTDSAEGKAVEFALFGKATQNTTSGKNLIPYPYTETSSTENGITWTEENGIITANGTATADATFYMSNKFTLKAGNYILSGCPSGGSNSSYRIQLADNSWSTMFADVGVGKEVTLLEDKALGQFRILIPKGVTANNLVFKPMLRLATDTDDTWEQPTNGATPRPDYTQEIEVAGESYNLIPYPYYETTKEANGVLFTLNENDGSIVVNGTATANGSFIFNHRIDNTMILGAGEYKVSGCPSGGSDTTYRLIVGKTSSAGSFEVVTKDLGSGAIFTLTEDTDVYVAFEVLNGATLSNLVVRPMIHKASVKNNRYMPYGKGSVEVKSVGKNLYNRNSDIDRTNVGVTATISEGAMVLNGTATGAGALPGYANDIVDTIDAKVGDILAFSIKILEGNATIASNTTLAFVRCMSENNVELVKPCNIGKDGGGIIDKTTEFAGKSFVVTEDMLGSDGRLRISIQSYVRTNDIYNNLKLAVQLEKNPVATEYQPYKETISTIPTPNGLAGIKVSSGGNYTDSNGQQRIADYFVKYADGSGEYVQRFGHLISSNSDGWFKIAGSLSQEDRFGIEVGVKMLSNLGISNYHNKVDNWGTGDNCIGFGTGESTTIYARFSGIESLEALNEKFNNVPFTAYYGLAEPIRTPLTAEQIAEIEKLCTFYPVTNISNDFDCGMKVKYNCDSKNYIDNKLAQIAAAVVNNI